MSETYKQKEYELKSAIDNINSISYIFEDYVKETNDYIDKLLEETKEINVLRNIIKEAREYIKRNAMYSEDWKKCCDDLYLDDCNELLEILDKENKDIELDTLKALNTDLDDDVEMG